MSFESWACALPAARARRAGLRNPRPRSSSKLFREVLEGHDLLAGAQTGTGKTAAFGLPLLQYLATSPQTVNGLRKPRALILTPTRELATQVHDSLRGYGKYQRIPSTVIYGGVGMGNQLDALRRGVDLVVACPGRLIDHLERRSVDLSGIEVLILDEADRMLDMGFLPSIKRILDQAAEAEPARRCCSRPPSPNRSRSWPRNSCAIRARSWSRRRTLSPRPLPTASTRSIPRASANCCCTCWRRTAACRPWCSPRPSTAADKLATFLDKSGIKTAAIHGNKSQGQRLRALGDFKAGRVTVLVATDIAARGIDIDQLPRVINFDLPMVAEDYVHRIGRTGRNGSSGEAISLVAQEDAKYLRQIVRLLNRDMDIRDLPGFEPQTPIRWGNSAPGKADQPSGQRPPRKHQARRPRTDGPRQAHAHAGAKQPGGAKPQGQRRRGGGGGSRGPVGGQR